MHSEADPARAASPNSPHTLTSKHQPNPPTFPSHARQQITQREHPHSLQKCDPSNVEAQSGDAEPDPDRAVADMARAPPPPHENEGRVRACVPSSAGLPGVAALPPRSPGEWEGDVVKPGREGHREASERAGHAGDGSVFKSSRRSQVTTRASRLLFAVPSL
jgi:hypothetical protein